MKNIIFWAGLLVATFWDEILIASIKPEKTKRQQQFFETGETAQYFIGAVHRRNYHGYEVISFLKSLFNIKKLPKSSYIYTLKGYKNIEVYLINGGVKAGHMTLFAEKFPKGIFYNVYIANGYKRFYDTEDRESRIFFGNNDRLVIAGDKEEILDEIWKNYIMEWNKFELYDKVENFEQIVQIAKTDIELAFLLLSGVPNIKKILS